MSAPVLIAGVGNVFFGDDGFGVEVARALCGTDLPPEAEVIDFGIGGFHLALRLLDPVRLLVVVDLVPRGALPGTLHVLEPALEPPDRDQPAEVHGMHLPSVLAAVQAMGGALPPIRVVGCEPLSVAEGMGLSPPVAAAVAPAARLVRELVERELSGSAAGAAAEQEVAP